ncbi:MAG: hypothetical protein E7430_01645 [Ruminococcaceae bacterium]|nr:hypothetical protein [Oscillospiraceae bacterium]
MKTIKKGETWLVETTTAVDGLTIEDGSSVAAPEGKCAIMTVNGALTDLLPGSYEGSIVISVVDKVDSWCGFENNYRSAVMFGKDGLNKSVSVLPAISGANIGDNGIFGGKITVRGNCFNGVSADSGKLRIDGTQFDYIGNGGDDFQLWGSAIAVGGDAEVVVTDANIKTKGVIATAVAAAGESKVLVKDSVIVSEGTDNANWYAKHPHLSEVPWVLGLKGTLRATNVLEAANVTYYNTDMTCNGWGVLSVDGTKGAVHNMVNVKASIPNDKGYASGYCAYILGGTTSTFLGCEFEVPDYVFSVGGNENLAIVGPSSQANLKERADLLAQLGSEVGFENIEEKPCIIKSKRFAGMWHHQSTGTFDIRPGTVIEAGDTAFLIKSDQRLNKPVILCDGVSIKSPVILHLMESDDPGMGVRAHDKCWAPNGEFFFERKKIEDFDTTDETAEGTVYSTFKNMELTGDFYNTKYLNGQNLSIVLDNTKLTGKISSGDYLHKDFSYGIAYDSEGKKVCTDKDGKRYVTETVEDLLFGKMPKEYTLPVVDETGCFMYAENGETLPLAGYGIRYADPEYLGVVDISVCEPLNNGVIVKLENGAEWTVAGKCCLTKLVIGEGCKITGADSKKLTMTVNGEITVPTAGTYTGVIEFDVA